MSAELEQLRKQYAKFRASLTQVENPLEQVNRMKEELGGLEASVTSPSGKVTVVAGPGGSIKDIVLAEDAVQIPASALAAELKSTVTQAVANAARQQAAIVDEHMGGHAAYDQVLQNQADALGTTVDQLKESMAASEPRPVQPPRNEDDYSENTLMSKADEVQPPAAALPGSGSGSAGDDFLKNLFDEDE